jgi:glycerate kinase
MAPGAGAAGGLGFGMLAYFGATLKNGAQIVIEATGLKDRLARADLCITGEGRLDDGSLHGKAPMAVARLCKSLEIPCIALVGSVGPGVEAVKEQGIDGFYPLDDGSRPIAETIRRSEELLAQLAELHVGRWLKRSE